MTSSTSSVPKLSTLKIPQGFCTAPMASFHSPKQLTSAQAGTTKNPIARPCATRGKTIRNTTAGRKTRAGTTASGAPIRNARSRSFKVMESGDLTIGPAADRFQMARLLALIHRLAANHRAQKFRLENFRRQSGSNILIEHHKISQHTRLQLALLLLRELGKS